MRRRPHTLKPEQTLRLLAYPAERPALNFIYRFKQRLCYLPLKKHKMRRQCQKLVSRFLRAIVELRQSGLAQLLTLGDTLHSWSEEIARMWRFTRSNGITLSGSPAALDLLSTAVRKIPNSCQFARGD